MTLSSNVADTSQQYFTNSSFSVTTQNMTGGGTTESSLLYGFTVPDGVGWVGLMILVFFGGAYLDRLLRPVLGVFNYLVVRF